MQLLKKTLNDVDRSEKSVFLSAYLSSNLNLRKVKKKKHMQGMSSYLDASALAADKAIIQYNLTTINVCEFVCNLELNANQIKHCSHV